MSDCTYSRADYYRDCDNSVLCIYVIQRAREMICDLCRLSLEIEKRPCERIRQITGTLLIEGLCPIKQKFP